MPLYVVDTPSAASCSIENISRIQRTTSLCRNNLLGIFLHREKPTTYRIAPKEQLVSNEYLASFFSFPSHLKGRIKGKVRKRRSLEGFSRHRSNSAWFTDFGPCCHNIHSYVPDKETSVFLRHRFPRRINVGNERNETDAKRQNEWRGTL